MATITGNYFRFVREIIRSVRWYAWLYLILSILYVVAPFVSAYILKVIIDGLVSGTLDNQALWQNSLYWFGFILLQGQVSTWWDFVRFYLFDENINEFFQKKLLTKVSSLDIAQLENQKVSSIVHRVESSLWWVTNKIVTSSDSLFRGLITLGISITIFTTVDPIWIAAIAFIGMLIAIGQFLESKHVYLEEMKREEDSKKMWILKEDLVSRDKLFELKVFDGVGYLFRQFSSTMDDIKTAKVKVGTKFNGIYSMVSFFSSLAMAAFLAYLVISVKDNVISVGSVVFLFSVFGRVSDTFTGLGWAFGRIGGLNVRMGEILYIFGIEPELRDGKKSLILKSAPEITLSNVWFKYPQENSFVLKGIDLAIAPGEKVAIVGKNGAGKTTLLKMLLRVYDPDKGDVFVNNENLREIKLASWYQNVGLMLQEYGAYRALTVEENIALSDIRRLKEKGAIKAAAAKADADEFIKKLASGYKTPLAVTLKGGTELSQGQWQKVAVARMFFESGKLLVLDEPTSAVDPLSEEKIFNKIYEEVRDKTVVIVSHRFTTVRGADRIIVVNDGKIIEQGTHRELLGKAGFYKEAYDSQIRRLKHGWDKLAE